MRVKKNTLIHTSFPQSNTNNLWSCLWTHKYSRKFVSDSRIEHWSEVHKTIIHIITIVLVGFESVILLNSSWLSFDYRINVTKSNIWLFHGVDSDLYSLWSLTAENFQVDSILLHVSLATKTINKNRSHIGYCLLWLISRNNALT